MRNQLPILKYLVFAAVLTVFGSGCSKKNRQDKLMKITIYQPVLESKTDFLANKISSAPRTLESPGKIFIYGKYLFVNESYKGVHVFDNSNERNPKAVAFINIPGNYDIAVKGDMLYADMYSDLLAIDISNPLHAKVTKDITNIFPGSAYYWNGDTTSIIVDWIKKDTFVEPTFIGCGDVYALNSASRESLYKASAPGKGGSMARFSIVNDYLYTVNWNSLGVFDIGIPREPVKKNDVSIGWGIETIYPFEGKLFIGSTTGMFIYDISQPEQPQQQGSFTHAKACDPVVANDEYAFVTLRSGSACGGVSNQLDVLNVKDVLAPVLIKSYQLTNPNGLAKDGNLLFVCDGDDGLKIFDASDVEKLKLLKRFEGMRAYDVIAWNNKLIMVADKGLYQYDYENDITLLSIIKTAEKKE